MAITKTHPAADAHGQKKPHGQTIEKQYNTIAEQCLMVCGRVYCTPVDTDVLFILAERGFYSDVQRVLFGRFIFCSARVFGLVNH